MADTPIKSVSTPWHDVLLICAKCNKKLKKRGFGKNARDSLSTALKNGLRQLGLRRTIRVAETGCFGVCPKKAICALRTGMAETILVIPAKTETVAILGRMELLPVPCILPDEQD
ncbi:hypothetical protein [Granulibacter bethesdensis]|uniref:hypothetical protein n=1 Tax=Granulibacter bethesdensis TaxID=364410 RepID=UPI0003F1CDA4|nr:hypothetical protein [Granulibacter bethesdensis]AHJ67255.1 Hypothetical protein GbCGDNIH2_0258 [Granulibacter bethesdensis]APH58552.1 Hypothetical protein GbCGDNIH7_0258 [Granulibacter bethesdensis]